METTFQASGSILGVGHKTTGTYTSEMRPDGTLYGEGQGIVMNSEGGGATWVGSAGVETTELILICSVLRSRPCPGSQRTLPARFRPPKRRVLREF